MDKTQCRYTDGDNQILNPNLDTCPEAISAVKILQIAASQGQKIYTITPKNAATTLTKLPLSGSTGDEIRQAIAAGKEVTFHERGISTHGWSGVGYSIIDPDSGVGSYLIEGKGNGSAFILGIAMLSFAFPPLAVVFFAGITASFASAITVAGLIGVMVYGVKSFIKKIDKVLKAENLTEEEKTASVKVMATFTIIGNSLGALATKSVAQGDYSVFAALFSLIAGQVSTLFGLIAGFMDFARGAMKEKE